MKKNILIGISASALLLTFAAWKWLQDDLPKTDTTSIAPASESVEQKNMNSIAKAKDDHADHQHDEGLQASPFELGNVSPEVLAEVARKAQITPKNMAALPEVEVVSPAEAERTKKLNALGYMLPPEYYSKDLKTLRRLAKAGDAFAMMHIGEKYYFEMQGQTQHPDFEKNMDYAKAAKQVFQDAVAAGNIRSAGIIAELYFQEKNPTEAYAWHLVSNQLGDDISAEWFRRTDMAMQASEAVKQAAAQRAAQILAELKLKKKTG